MRSNLDDICCYIFEQAVLCFSFRRNKYNVMIVSKKKSNINEKKL